jgi:hypothetical protein
MKKLLTSSFFFFIIALLLTFAFKKNTTPVFAATASHIVISEVQIAGGVSTDEFVELYNPTNSNVDLTNWRLAKKTASGTESDLVTDFPAKTINAHGYLLLAHTDYDGAVIEDITYSTSSVAVNNTVLLYNSSDTVVDKLGFGSATDVETTSKAEPSTNDSVERKASATSDGTTLAVGGTEENAGNGEDTDNNSVDFVNRTEPLPQNIASALEPGNGLTPTPTVSLSPTLTPTGSVSATPSLTGTLTPTISPTSLPSVTLTPTTTVSVTPTLTVTSTSTPTVTMTPSPTQTVSVTPTKTPTPSMTVTPTPPTTSGGLVFGTFIFPNKTIVCKVDFKVRVKRFLIMYVPVFTCSEV